MLSFSRQTDYALIALAHLAGREGNVASAREIALAYALSVPLVMKVLKVLQHKAIVTSVRGVKGGYQLGVDLHNLSLYHLIEALKGEHSSSIDSPPNARGTRPRMFRQTLEPSLPTEPPLLAVHSKLMRFLKDVRLSDLVLPGRRIDVPVEMVGRHSNPNFSVAALAATT